MHFASRLGSPETVATDTAVLVVTLIQPGVHEQYKQNKASVQASQNIIVFPYYSHSLSIFHPSHKTQIGYNNYSSYYLQEVVHSLIEIATSNNCLE